MQFAQQDMKPTLTLKSLKKICISALNNTIARVVGLIVAPILASWVLGTSDNVILVLEAPMQLWVAIVLAFLTGLLLFLISKRIHTSGSPKEKHFSVENDKIKWISYMLSNTCCGLVKNPYCKKHDLQMVKKGSMFICPGNGIEKCKNAISVSKNDTLYKEAKARFERTLRLNNLHLGTS